MSKSEYNKAYALGIKYEVMEHYAGGPPRCMQCGETDLRQLHLDHVNNDGKQHRIATIGVDRGSGQFYRYLRRNHYPHDVPLQVLCRSCNNRKSRKPPIIVHGSITLDGYRIEPIDGEQLALWEDTDEEGNIRLVSNG